MASTVEVLNTTAVNFPRPGHADTFLDPYGTSTEYYFHKHGDSFLSKYNISTDTDTVVNSMATNFLQIKRDWITRRVYGLRSNTIVDLGVDYIELDNFAEVNALQTAKGLYTHPTTLDFFELSFTGKIYFRANSKSEIWSMDSDGTNAVKMFDSDGSGGRGPVASDPLDDDSIVYVDGANIVHRVISTGVTTVVVTGDMESCPGIFLLDGVVYANYRFKFGAGKGFVIHDITGTLIYSYQGSGNFVWAFGFVIDYANKMLYTLDDTKYHAHSYPSMADLPPDPYVPELSVTFKSVYANVNWLASNTYYRIDITDPSLTTSTVTSGILDLEFTVSNLLPETSYTVELYTSSDDVTYNLESSATFTTLENTAANFDSSEFFDGTEMLYDFESFDSGTLAIIGEIFDELFVTGDTLRLKDSTDVTYNTSFVENGSTVTLSDNSSFYIPFESTAGSGQQVTLTLSDTTTVLVEYNELTGKIQIDGTTTYSVGNSFILDGKTIFVSST